MNRDRLRELLPIMQAYVDGKTVQYKYVSGTSPGSWHDVTQQAVNWHDSSVVWRIKPEVREYYCIRYADGSESHDGASKDTVEGIVAVYNRGTSGLPAKVVRYREVIDE